jgi:hypothetical protein
MESFDKYLLIETFTKLNENEVSLLEDNGESEDGFLAVKTDFETLNQLGVSTTCGRTGNLAFGNLLESIGNRKVIGWFNPDDKEICGMIQIEGKEDEGEKIEDEAWKKGAILRFSGLSQFPGFLEFENE